MTLPATWPEAIRRFVHEACGLPAGVERLGGMSGARVFRVRAAGGSIIIKAAAPAEVRFYRAVAPVLARYGVATPALRWSTEETADHWLVLEDVPHPLPRERWTADPEVLAMLARLHGSGVMPASGPDTGYRPTWAARLTDEALAQLRRDERDELGPALGALREAHQHLFAPRCAISGDPNPTNWGLRDDGGLVLFDWERFSRGTPALDLAITIPGLGDLAAFRRVAKRYLQLAPGDPVTGDPERLARDIAVAKVWSVLEFLGRCNDGDQARADTGARIAGRLPGWVRSTVEGMNAPA